MRRGQCRLAHACACQCLTDAQDGCLGVAAEAEGVREASAQGHDVLQGTAQLHPRDVVGGLDAEVVRLEQPLPRQRMGRDLTANGSLAELALSHLACDVCARQHSNVSTWQGRSNVVRDAPQAGGVNVHVDSLDQADDLQASVVDCRRRVTRAHYSSCRRQCSSHCGQDASEELVWQHAHDARRTCNRLRYVGDLQRHACPAYTASGQMGPHAHRYRHARACAWRRTARTLAGSGCPGRYLMFTCSVLMTSESLRPAYLQHPACMPHAGDRSSRNCRFSGRCKARAHLSPNAGGSSSSNTHMRIFCTGIQYQ